MRFLNKLGQLSIIALRPRGPFLASQCILYPDSVNPAHSSLNALKSRDTTLLRSLAIQFNLSYNAFGISQSDEDAPAYGTLTLSEPFHDGLEPAPITPIDEMPYQLLSGTIRATYNTRRSPERKNITVMPGIMSGNTGKLDNSCADMDSDEPH